MHLNEWDTQSEWNYSSYNSSGTNIPQKEEQYSQHQRDPKKQGMFHRTNSDI